MPRSGPTPCARRGHPVGRPRPAERPGAAQCPRGGGPHHPGRRGERGRLAPRGPTAGQRVQVAGRGGGRRAHRRGRAGRRCRGQQESRAPAAREAAAVGGAARCRAAARPRPATEGRDMLEQAQEARRRVLADMAQRRQALHIQIEQFRAARDQLAATVRRRARVGRRHRGRTCAGPTTRPVRPRPEWPAAAAEPRARRRGVGPAARAGPAGGRARVVGRPAGPTDAKDAGHRRTWCCVEAGRRAAASWRRARYPPGGAPDDAERGGGPSRSVDALFARIRAGHGRRRRRVGPPRQPPAGPVAGPRAAGRRR